MIVAIGLASALPARPGAEPWTGSNRLGNRARRVDVARGRQAQRAHQRAADVGQDVPEQVAGDDHVQLLRVEHEARRQRVHVLVLDADLGVLLAHQRDDLVPEHHGVVEGVRLGAGDELLLALHRQVEGVADDALGALAGEERGLGHDLIGGARADPAADAAVLALGVLADRDEVDVRGGPIAQRARDARQQLGRPQVDVQVERLADRQQHGPQGHVVRDAGEADGAQEDARPSRASGPSRRRPSSGRAWRSTRTTRGSRPSRCRMIR